MDMITEIDRQDGRRMGWHNKTNVRSDLSLANNWLTEWDLVKSPLFTADMAETDYALLTCTDNPRITVGGPVHRETYGFLSNRDFLEIIRESISGIRGAKVDSVGSVCGRGRIFVSVSLPEVAEFTAAGRAHLGFLSFLSSHDMSAPFLVNASNVCVVCDNTFRANLHDKSGKGVRVRVPHTKNASRKLENVPAIVEAYYGTQAVFKAKLDAMASEEVDTSKAERFFAGFLTVDTVRDAEKLIATKPEIEVSTRRANQVSRLAELFVSGKGNNGRNVSDIFGAVTDYYSHESAGGDNVWKQIAASEVGNGHENKARAFDILSDRKAFDAFAKAGDFILASAN